MAGLSGEIQIVQIELSFERSPSTRQNSTVGVPVEVVGRQRASEEVVQHTAGHNDDRGVVRVHGELLRQASEASDKNAENILNDAARSAEPLVEHPLFVS